jgi:hypothetical protein
MRVTSEQLKINYLQMKIYFKILIFFFLAFSNYSMAINNDEFIKKLKNVYSQELPSTFFVIQANTLLSTFTQSPQIIERLEEIKKYHLCPYIIMIWKDDAGIGKNFYKYLKENYYIDTTAFLKAIISDELYSELGYNINTTIHYFYNQKHFIKIDGKYESLSKIFLPYDIVSIKFDDKYLLEDDEYYHTNQVNYYPLNDTLAIELFDGHQDRVRLTNIINGKVNKVFDLNQIDHIELFNKFMNYLNLSEDELKKNNDYLNKIRRTPLRIDNVYIKNLSEIYLIGTAMISYRTPYIRYIPSDFKKETITIKPGDYVTDDFDIIIKTDTSFKVKDFNFINTILSNDYNNNNFIDPTGGIYIDEKGNFYMFGYNFCKNSDRTYKEFFKRNKNTNFIHTFVSDGLNLNFRQKEKSKLHKPLGSFYFYQEGVYFFGTKDNVFAKFSIFPEIFSIKHEIPIAKTTHEKLNYSFLKNNYDTLTSENVPYYCFYPGFLFSNKILTLLIRVNQKFYLKLLDSDLNTIQELDVTEILHLKKEMSSLYFYSNMAFFSDNYLNTIYCNSSGCYNYRYKLSFSPVNSIYFERKENFIK